MQHTGGRKPDKIVLLVIFYVALVISSLICVYSADSYMQKRLLYLTSLHDNETSKIHLNNILKNRISTSKTTLLSYLNAYSYKDMDVHEKKLIVLMNDITEVLYVLEKGGEYIEKVRISLPEGEKDITHKIRFESHNTSRYNIPVIDLRTRVIKISSYTDSLRSLVIDSILYKHSGNAEKIRETGQRVNESVRSLELFFAELDNSLCRLYLESEESSQTVQEVLGKTTEKYRKVSIGINLLLGTVLTAAGVLFCIAVFRMVRSRNHVSSELNRLNNTLEETVSQRTKELKAEMRIREQKEKESIAKAQFLMDVIESLSHPFYVIDAETYEIILANNAAYEIIGSTGTTCYELTHRANHPCDGIDHPCPLKSVKETGAPITVEHIHIVRGGEKRYFEVHGYPVKDQDGTVIQMIEYALDITDKKDAEFALVNLNSMLEEKVAERTRKLEMEMKQREVAEERTRTREKHFRQLIANISDIIAILDKNMRIKYLSPSVENITDFTPDQLLGKSFEDLIHSRDRKMFEIWMERILNREGESRVIEFRFQKRNGSWISGEALAKNMLDNETINGIVINVRDITMRKKAEDEIRKLALVMDQNPNSILVTDLDGNIEYVNPAFEKITGYSMSEVIGQNPSVLKTEHTPERVFTELWETITAGKVWNGEFVNKKKNGELYIEHAIIAPITNDRGEIINYLGMKENITELKKAREKAEESNKAKSMFLANMSHEIRTPLNGLMGFLDLLKETSLNTEQKGYVSTIKFSADALLGILNNILDLSKIESGMLEIEKAEIDLGYNILATSKTFYARANENGIRIYTYIDPDIPRHLMGDSLRINQVVANLIGNAIKFTPQKGIVKVDAKLVKQSKKKAHVLVSVEDNGVGIPADKLESIFDSFAQVDISITRKYGGTGLGLTITRDLLKLMGADINVESTEGKGSTFSFELKLEKVSAGELEKTTSVKNKILISGKEPAELYELITKYLESVEAEYIYTDNPLTEEGISEACVVLLNMQPENLDALAEAAERVVLASSYSGRQMTGYAEGNVIKLSAPFGGREFYEALSGVEYTEALAAGEELRIYKGRVLVAEDNSVNMKMMDSMLSRLGIDVDKAENGAEALEKSTSGRYDLVFMDINMPEMDGATAARKIRENEKSFYKKRVPVVALTAHTAKEMEGTYEDSDFDGYLTKPVKINDVDRVLGQFLLKMEDDEDDVKHFDYLESACEIGLPKSIVENLLVNFSAQAQKDAAELKELVETKNYEKVKSVANSNKGAAENLRMAPVSAIFNSIEKSARLKNDKDILESIDRLTAELEILKLNIPGA